MIPNGAKLVRGQEVGIKSERAWGWAPARAAYIFLAGYLIIQ